MNWGLQVAEVAPEGIPGRDTGVVGAEHGDDPFADVRSVDVVSLHGDQPFEIDDVFATIEEQLEDAECLDREEPDGDPSTVC
jgi:hypothetical protein